MNNQRITLTARQLRDALTLIGEDKIGDDDDAEITIKHLDIWIDRETNEPQPAGLYAYLEDYPEFGLYGPLGEDSPTTLPPALPETV